MGDFHGGFFFFLFSSNRPEQRNKVSKLSRRRCTPSHFYSAGRRRKPKLYILISRNAVFPQLLHRGAVAELNHCQFTCMPAHTLVQYSKAYVSMFLQSLHRIIIRSAHGLGLSIDPCMRSPERHFTAAHWSLYTWTQRYGRLSAGVWSGLIKAPVIFTSVYHWIVVIKPWNTLSPSLHSSAHYWKDWILILRRCFFFF